MEFLLGPSKSNNNSTQQLPKVDKDPKTLSDKNSLRKFCEQRTNCKNPLSSPFFPTKIPEKQELKEKKGGKKETKDALMEEEGIA